MKWYGTTNSGVFVPFEIHMSTGLTDTPVWSNLGVNIPRAGTGTNEWWDTTPAKMKVFFRPIVTWTNFPTP